MKRLAEKKAIAEVSADKHSREASFYEEESSDLRKSLRELRVQFVDSKLEFENSFIEQLKHSENGHSKIVNSSSTE